jgi:hypothetical protein
MSHDLRTFRAAMDSYVAVVLRRDSRRDVEAVALVLPDRTEVAIPMGLHDDDTEMSAGFEWGYGGQGPHALAFALIGVVAKRTHRPGAESAIRAMGYRVGEFTHGFVAGLDRGAREIGIPRWELEAEVARFRA